MVSRILDKKLEYQEELWEVFEMSDMELEHLRDEVRAMAEGLGREEEFNLEQMGIYDLKAYMASMVGLDTIIEARDATITARKQRGDMTYSRSNASQFLKNLRAQRSEQIYEQMSGMSDAEKKVFATRLSKYEKEDVGLLVDEKV